MLRFDKTPSPTKWCNHNATCKANDTPPSGSRRHQFEKRAWKRWERRQLKREVVLTDE